MRQFVIAGMAIAGLCLSGAAGATRYAVDISGRLSTFYTVDGDFHRTADPPTTLASGDPVSVSFRFDTSRFARSAFTPDPAVAFYDGPITDLVYTIGGFSSRPDFGETDTTSFLLWDDYTGAISRPVDAITFAVYRYIPGSSSPVDLGDRRVFLDFGFDAFDFSATARSSLDFNDPLTFTSYGSKSAFVGFLAGSGDDLTVSVNSLTDIAASITALPEPTTWAMLICGFGIVGGRLRRHRRDPATA